MKNKDKNKKNNIKNQKNIKDLTSFVSAEDLRFDPFGSYTGTTAATYFGDDYDEPIQDADDL
ncbi:MAG: hypothetical protein ACLUFN_05555 [Eubacterium sp.]